MSIATKRGDTGQTGLLGGVRVSKSHLRVETYGTIDELISSMGFARAICPDEDLQILTKELQRELFKVGSAFATPPESKKPIPEIPQEMVDRLTDEVHRIEAIEVCWAIGRSRAKMPARLLLTWREQFAAVRKGWSSR